MKIKTYEMILDEETRHIKLQAKETFDYEKGIQVSTPRDVYEMMCALFHLEKCGDEYVYMLAFNTKMRVLGIFEVSHGLGNVSLVDARAVFMRALQIGANNIILVHNHPSGDVTPSEEDMKIYKKLHEAGQMLDIPLVEFMVVADGFYSFQEHTLIKSKRNFA
ncbi:MAG: JAB domain-containing protein [Lachnospiraceae bacterium]|nr:JAB domain-containing protein [Lachnospiraceae bacterium]